MLHFFRRLFSRTARRQIFRFHDGARWRLADPMLILRQIDEHPTWVPRVHLPLLAQQDEFGRDAVRETVTAIRKIFGFQGLGQDGSGLTEDETIRVWLDFCAFLDALKKNGFTQPTLPPPTDFSPPDSSPIGALPSASGSTDSEPLTAEPCRFSTP